MSSRFVELLENTEPVRLGQRAKNVPPMSTQSVEQVSTIDEIGFREREIYEIKAAFSAHVYTHPTTAPPGRVRKIEEAKKVILDELFGEMRLNARLIALEADRIDDQELRSGIQELALELLIQMGGD